MRKLLTGALAAVLALGLMAAEPAEAKVYKMKPEERAAALKEKKERKARAKKSKKAGEEAPGGWVEVKPGSKAAVGEKKSRRNKVDDIAQAAEQKAKKSKASKKAKKDKVAEAAPAKKEAKAPKKEAKEVKVTKASKKKSKDRNVAARDAFRESREGARVRASSAEVSRPAGAVGGVPAGGPNLDSYSVSRPGYEKGAAPSASPPVVPEVRHEVQPGPVDSSKPLGTEVPKAGEGRF